MENVFVKWANCCRLCLLEDGIKLPIFEGEGAQRKIAEKIKTCFPILIYIGDPLPKMICHKCLYKLDTVYEFRLRCMEANSALKRKLHSLQHVPAVRHYLSKLDEKISEQGVCTSSKPIKVTTIINKTHTRIKSVKSLPRNGAGSMFQGIFIKDCPGEAFLPEQAEDIRQKSDSATAVNNMDPSTSKNTALNVTSATSVRTTVQSTIMQHSNVSSKANMMLSTSRIIPMNVTSATTLRTSPEMTIMQNTGQSKDNQLLNTMLSPERSVRPSPQESPMLNALLSSEKRPVLRVPVPMPRSEIRNLKKSQPNITIPNIVKKEPPDTASSPSIHPIARSQKTIIPVPSVQQSPPGAVLSTETRSPAPTPVSIISTSQTYTPPTSMNSLQPTQTSQLTQSPKSSTIVHPKTSTSPTKSQKTIIPLPSVQQSPPGAILSIETPYRSPAPTPVSIINTSQTYTPPTSMNSLQPIQTSQLTQSPKSSTIVHPKTSTSPTKSFFKQHGISPWHCKFCNKYYKTRETLQKHKKYSCPNKSICSKCGKVLSTAKELAIHQKSHIKICLDLPIENLLPCTVCDRKFAARSMLHMHKKTHDNMQQNPLAQPEKQYKCLFCPRMYVKKFNLDVHMRTVHSQSGINQQQNVQLFAYNSEGTELSFMPEDQSKPQWQQQCSCKYCGHICENSTELWMHMINKHSKEQAFRCEKCGKEFNQQQAYLNHKRTMCVKVHCKTCGKIYSSPKALREHEWNKHGVERASHCCQLCGESFVTRSALLIHSRVHHVVKKNKNSAVPVSLEQIDVPQLKDNADTLSKQQHEQHQQLLQQEAPTLPCKICFRKFRSSQGLQRHEQIHATGKHVFYPCEFCGKKFVSLEMYKTHAATHAVSKSFHCSPCNKIFFKEEVFRSHSCESRGKQACLFCGSMLTEQEQLSHVCGKKDDVARCSHCPAVFSSHKGLTGHMRMHNNRQTENKAPDFKRTCILLSSGYYKCNICGKVTPTQQGAAAHSRWHVGPPPVRRFKCPFCNRSYYLESGLYTHIAIEHPESST